MERPVSPTPYSRRQRRKQRQREVEQTRKKKRVAKAKAKLEKINNGKTEDTMTSTTNIDSTMNVEETGINTEDDNNPTTIVDSSVQQSNNLNVKDISTQTDPPPNLKNYFNAQYPNNFYTEMQNRQTIPTPVEDGFPGTHPKTINYSKLKQGIDIARQRYPGVNPGRSLLYTLRPIAETTAYSVVKTGLRHDVPTTI